MGYLFVKSEVLVEKGIEHYETLPDGRAIVDFSMLRVLGSIPDVEVVSTAEEVLRIKKEQEESGLYNTDEIPAEGEQVPTEEQIPNEEIISPVTPSEQTADKPIENETEQTQAKTKDKGGKK